MFVFLSCADEDREIAREVADHLRSNDVTVYSSQGMADTAVPAVSEPDCAIQQADAFLALLSPDFLTSTSCRRERELALRRDQCHPDDGSGTDFIQVLKIRETPYQRAAALHNHPWLDLTGEAAAERVLNDLASKFVPPGPPSSGGGSPGSGNGRQPPNNGRPRRLSPDFRNRTRELEEISGELKDPDGDHFWIVIAPPQLGKSWFLDRLAQEFESRNVWVVKLVDAQDLPPETLGDADAILRLMFGLAPDAPSARMTESIAGIVTNNRVHLCLLDSAELLARRTVRRLRQHLGDIDQRVAKLARGHAGYPRVMFVAASRRDDEWKGVSPAPRLRIRRLREFKLEVIRDVVDKMRLPLSDAERQGVAERVHRLSEGLPALLTECLNAVREQGWDVDMTGDQATFDLIARPYIEQGLLSASSLRSRGSVLADDQQAALKQALLLTSLYRFLTVTHLSDHVERGDLPAANQLQWTAERLWLALSDTDLLYRPEREPWYEIHTPIRRLLFRHAYPSAAERIEAHRSARTFMQTFTPKLTGTDQCRAHAECLWHEAQALMLAESSDVADALVGYARQMDSNLTPTDAFDKPTLREMVARNIRNDEEFADSLADVPDLLDRLTEVIRQPQKE